jgi:hypothetical protein
VSIRWTTGVGIAVGGVSGALLALLGVARAPAPEPAQVAPQRRSAPLGASSSATPAESAPLPSPRASSSGAAEEPLLVASAAASVAEVSSAVAGSAPKAPETSEASFLATPALELPTTREALLRAELYCDKRQDFDECGRAAGALEAGSAGPVDLVQAKRFRRIALTHLVSQCEAGSAHACFVIAAKYRAGTELASSPVRAEALEKRGLELCRLGSGAPECPPAAAP